MAQSDWRGGIFPINPAVVGITGVTSNRVRLFRNESPEVYVCSVFASVSCGLLIMTPLGLLILSVMVCDFRSRPMVTGDSSSVTSNLIVVGLSVMS